MVRYVDYLAPDPEISGQRYFLVSHAQLSDGSWWCKFGGAWDSLEQAQRVAQQRIKVDDSFNIAAGPVGQWVPAIPTPENTENVEYSDERLNTLFKGYVEGQRAAKEHFIERKEAVMRDGLDAHLTPEEIIPRGPGPPPPIDERGLRELAQAEGASEPSESTTVNIPLTSSSSWIPTG